MLDKKIQQEFDEKLLGSTSMGKEFRKFVFTETETKREWDSFDPQLKKSVMSHLHDVTSQMQSKIAIEMLCCVIEELIERIEILETKKESL